MALDIVQIFALLTYTRNEKNAKKIKIKLPLTLTLLLCTLTSTPQFTKLQNERELNKVTKYINAPEKN